MRWVWDGLLKIETMLHCHHNEPVKSLGRDYINWNVKFVCHLSHAVKNHSHDAVEAEFQGVLLETGRKPGPAWAIS
jgi:hypothetical protein